MTRLKYIAKSFFHFLKANLIIASGVAISTMVLTGSLIIGDSVKYSLEQVTWFRLGKMTHLVAVRERYFRQEMANEMEAINPDIKVSPLLMLEGVALADGGRQRVNRIQVAGVDSGFEKIAGTGIFSELEGNQIIVSRNLAEKLEVAEGDFIMIRIKKASLMPMNAPFVSDEEISVSLRAGIKKVVDKEEMGRFNLKTSQTAPYNVFVSLDQLNRLMEFQGRANHLLISSGLEINELKAAVTRCLTPADAGLKSRFIETTGESQISSERVFMEPAVAQMLEQLPSAKPLITYFVNEIALYKGASVSASTGSEKKIPYSFVSSLGEGQLNDNEIILTQWAADDLGAIPGDRVSLKYYEIGPLRQMIDKEADFILKEIVPMDNTWADSTRMPMIPGLSDAGHCREWEAGVPVNLDAIREKDEKYWEQWKGAPKAYISLNKAKELWANRFGIYTAVRFPPGEFSEKNYRETFAERILPGNLGMMIEPVREDGLSAARNGTDFSGLFLGLSFFILIAAIILAALLFRLNLEKRSAEVGILSALGFKQKNVRGFFLWEGLLVALSGALAGLILSVFYTSGVFKILNSLWFDIVRTDVLLIKIKPFTLALGLVISVLVSLGAIFLSIRNYQMKKISELQKRSFYGTRKRVTVFRDALMWISLMVSVTLVLSQLWNRSALNPVFFFISGAALLLGLMLLFARRVGNLESSGTDNVRLGKLAGLNLARNPGRSLTVVILLALGTFTVISTGSYKFDLLSGSRDKSGGTGGFLFFASSTMPVLYNLNDPGKRAEEGIYEDFEAIQFRQVEGDDASCLNLNRIAQPAILGVNPESLKGRFSFAATSKAYGQAEPWSLLDESFDDGTIPAIADQTVIQWGLGKKVGDVLLYQNEKGDTLRLRLVAGTNPSIFQGYVLISNENFLANYPSSSGSHVFLVDGDPGREQQIGEELSSVFRDFGWEMEPASRRLVEFYSVTNTYLRIFLALGALGMILGTIGLAVILARTILERRYEIALMQAIGFNTRQLFIMLVNEYLLLLVSGVLTGFIAAVVATLPSFISSNTDASFKNVAFITLLILLNGMVWVTGLCWLSLRKKQLVTSLNAE